MPSISNGQQRYNRCSSTTKNYSPQIIRKELALIRSRSDDKVDELMRAVHKTQDLAFHLKTAEKAKSVCFKKEEQVSNLQRQLSFWQHMNSVQNEKITQQLATIAKGRDELAGLNEQIFEMQERLVKIRVKFGVGNKEHKAPSTKNSLARPGRISASAEPSLCITYNTNSCNGNINDNSSTKTPFNDKQKLLLDNIDENERNNEITTRRCWQTTPGINSLEFKNNIENTEENNTKIPG